VAGRVAIVLFNRDLRTHDHPALAAACAEAVEVLPLFVLDERFLRPPRESPNRLRFLHASLEDLADGLRRLGGDLVVLRGDPVRETIRLAVELDARSVHASHDVSATARRRERELARACAAHGIELTLHPGVTVVPPDELRTAAGGSYRVFTPFWRRWEAASRRPLLGCPKRVRVPASAPSSRLPALKSITVGPFSPAAIPGGERPARRALAVACASVVPEYGKRHDLLGDPISSRLSPYLHFGCISPLEVETAARRVPGHEPFVRQLAWRDFHHQMTEANPTITHVDLRPRGRAWTRDGEELEAWCSGLTGYPIVDAGMRQLIREGWMHGRARMIAATFLTKHLGHDWREGAHHFSRLLIDADVANNAANWQWVAGTGADTRPGRILNPLRQAERFDREGTYVRRYLPELAHLDRRFIQTPWLLPEAERTTLRYPERLVDHELAAAAYRTEAVERSDS
jgi:deoxyribodipyrimidine photo-lyase